MSSTILALLITTSAGQHPAEVQKPGPSPEQRLALQRKADADVAVALALIAISNRETENRLAEQRREEERQEAERLAARRDEERREAERLAEAARRRQVTPSVSYPAQPVYYGQTFQPTPIHFAPQPSFQQPFFPAAMPAAMSPAGAVCFGGT